jgi:hypothetical protein
MDRWSGFLYLAVTVLTVTAVGLAYELDRPFLRWIISIRDGLASTGSPTKRCSHR